MKKLDKDTAAILNAEAKLELARRSLIEFALYTKPDYQAVWYHKLLCEYLDAFAQKKIRRLMIFLPPRHGKSELVSRRLPAFILGHNPNAKIIATSYSSDLAQRMNLDVQRIMSSNEYRKLFPESAFSGIEKRSASEVSYLRNTDLFEIVGYQGSYRSAGVNGGIVGMGGDYIIIDDPIKNRDEANSATYRARLYEWFTSTLYTRREKDACILLTNTRWHEDDLAGKLIETAKKPHGDKWEIISIPAIRDTRDCPYDPRAEGEALWPEQFDLEDLLTTKATIGSYEWAAQYQQQPSPREGGLFKREWWKYWDEDTLPDDLSDFLQSWDCTFSDSDDSDYVVGQVWARSSRKMTQRYLLDQVRGRMTFTETLNAIRNLSAKWPRTERKLIEDKANGTAVIDVLRHEIHGVVPVDPKGGKISRAQAITANVEAGNVYIPSAQMADWVGDFIEELSTFPSGRHDDQVDAMTQANAWYNENQSDWSITFF